jgi:hypothetical protein
MTGNTLTWFHCGHCNALFESELDLDQSRSCPDCGENPAVASDLSKGNLFNPKQDYQALEQAPPSQKIRKNKSNYLWLKLGGCLLVFFATLVIGARLLWQDDPRALLAEQHTPSINAPLDDDELEFRKEAQPPCNKVFFNFITATTAEARNQFIADPLALAARIAKFYALNPVEKIDPNTLKLDHQAKLDLPNGQALETLWSGDHKTQYNAVFVKQDGEWRLDWNHFIRYSDYPWELFLAGSGELTGEFRLLARERLGGIRGTNEPMNIVFYAPRFGTLLGAGKQSPEFVIERTSEMAPLLSTAFQIEREGRRPFGLRQLRTNSEQLIPVQVRVRRTIVDGQRHFELEKVIACHWYSEKALGMEIPSAPVSATQ